MLLTLFLLHILEDRVHVSTVNLMASVKIDVPNLPALPIIYEGLHSQATCVFKKSDSFLPNLGLLLEPMYSKVLESKR